MRGMIALFIATILLAGCETLPPAPSVVQGPYRLDSGDHVRVIVYNEQSLSTDYSVGDNGAISFPMVGEIPARNLTTDDLQKAIVTKLKQGILVNPAVSVEVSTYRPFFVLGEVGKPGQFPYTAGLNVLSAVAVAGGFTIRADKDDISLVRTQNGQSVEWHADRLTPLLPGDVITVPERFF